jgi:hypothetical protein
MHRGHLEHWDTVNQFQINRIQDSYCSILRRCEEKRKKEKRRSEERRRREEERRGEGRKGKETGGEVRRREEEKRREEKSRERHQASPVLMSCPSVLSLGCLPPSFTLPISSCLSSLSPTMCSSGLMALCLCSTVLCC